MNINRSGISLMVAAALPLVSFSSAAYTGMDARGGAMGGTGVASASYLTAAFYNPAMATHYKDNDDFGLLLPSINVSAHDADDMMTKLDDFQKLNDRLESDPSVRGEWEDALRALDNGQIAAEAKVGMVVSIPNRFVSASLFTKADVAAFAVTEVADSDFTNPNPNDLDSMATGLAGGTVDLGMTLAKSFELSAYGKRFSVGVSPKFQKLVALNMMESVSTFDFEIDDPEQSSAFNMDLGVSYQPIDNVTIGFSAMNLISQELETNKIIGDAGESYSATFMVEPQYKLGAAYANGWFTIAADVDLNKQQYFKQFDYSTQFAKLGVELDAWQWAQLRAGYSHSMTDHAESLMTAGIGFTPFGAFGFDLAGQFGKDNNYGVSAQLVFTL
ncbi:conjugal transfer protein TraF [Photobacterium swingsii]|uniref:conjugal transfer protein TraF n=1 Tax=Photobacterium swingsii TaxID=680026 RepID=UPI00352FD90A